MPPSSKIAHVHVLSPGDCPSLESLSEAKLASTRLRLWPAAKAASQLGYSVTCDDRITDKPDIIIVGKIIHADFLSRSKLWLANLRKAKLLGAKVIVDYTDHHLGFDSPLTVFYQDILPLIDMVIVPHRALGDALKRFLPSHITPVIVEDLQEYIIRPPSATKKSEKTDTLLWFGHESNFQFLESLCKSWPVSAGRRLHIVSSQIVLDFLSAHGLQSSVNLEILFDVWTTSAVRRAAERADLAIIPSDHESDKQFASSNRLVTALTLGLPVVATPIPSYLEFQKYFYALGSAEANAVFENPRAGLDKVDDFQAKFPDRFSMQAIRNRWSYVLQSLIP